MVVWFPIHEVLEGERKEAAAAAATAASAAAATPGPRRDRVRECTRPRCSLRSPIGAIARARMHAFSVQEEKNAEERSINRREKDRGRLRAKRRENAEAKRKKAEDAKRKEAEERADAAELLPYKAKPAKSARRSR